MPRKTATMPVFKFKKAIVVKAPSPPLSASDCDAAVALLRKNVVDPARELIASVKRAVFVEPPPPPPPVAAPAKRSIFKLFKFKKAVAVKTPPPPPSPPSPCEAAASYLSENVVSPVKDSIEWYLPAERVNSLVEKFVEKRFYIALAAVVLFTLAVCVHGLATRVPSPPKNGDDEEEATEKEEEEEEICPQPTTVPASVSVDDSELTKLTAELTAAGDDSDSDDSGDHGKEGRDPSLGEETREELRPKVIDTETKVNFIEHERAETPPPVSKEPPPKAVDSGKRVSFVDQRRAATPPPVSPLSTDSDNEAETPVPASDAADEIRVVAPVAGDGDGAFLSATGPAPDEAPTPVTTPDAAEGIRDVTPVTPVAGDGASASATGSAPEEASTPVPAPDAAEGIRDVAPVTPDSAIATPIEGDEASISPGFSVATGSWEPVPARRPSLKKRISNRIRRGSSGSSVASAGSKSTGSKGRGSGGKARRALSLVKMGSIGKLGKR